MSREGLELARVAQARGVPVVLSPICWYEPRALAALEPGPLGKLASLAAWGLRSRGAGDPELAARAAAAGRSRPAQFALRGDSARASLRGRRASESASCPTACFPSVGVGVAGAVSCDRWGAGPVRPFRRADRAAQEHAGADPGDPPARAAAGGHRRGSAGLRGLRARMPPRGRRVASSGWGGSTITIRSWHRRMPRRGSSPCRAGSRRRAWPRSRRRSRVAAVAITPYGSTREYFGDLVEYARPDRPGGDRPSRGRNAGKTVPILGWRGRIATHYLWPKVAQITAEVYDQVAR